MIPNFTWNQFYVIITEFEFRGSGTWELGNLRFSGTVSLRCGRGYAFLLLICILHLDQTYSCTRPSHWRSSEENPPPCHPQSHFVLLSTQGHAWAWGASITGQISDRWGDLGKLPSNSLVSSSFKACLLAISVHLCKSFFFLPEFNIKTKQWGKSEKKKHQFQWQC